MQTLVDTIRLTAECRSPLLLRLEDVPGGTSHAAQELLQRAADHVSAPLHVFELRHMDEKIAGRRIADAIHRGAWLLLAIPEAFTGADVLLRDIGRRMFTIAPAASRPLMADFRLIVALCGGAVPSAVFRKLAVTIPAAVCRAAAADTLDADTDPAGLYDGADSAVHAASLLAADCAIGPMFFRRIELDGNGHLRRPPPSRPQTASLVDRRRSSLAPPPPAAPVDAARDDPLEARREQLLRERFEHDASVAADRMYRSLLQSRQSYGHEHARALLHTWTERLDAEEPPSVARQRRRTTAATAGSIASVAAEAAASAQSKTPFELLAGPVVGGMRRATWRGARVLVRPAPGVRLPGPQAAFPSHPLLLSPMALLAEHLLYPHADVAALPMRDVKAAIAAAAVAGNAILALDDMGLAYASFSTGAVVSLPDDHRQPYRLLVDRYPPTWSQAEGGGSSGGGDCVSVKGFDRRFLSPEALQSGSLVRSDMSWAFAVLFYCLLFGGIAQHPATLYPGAPTDREVVLLVTGAGFAPQDHFPLPPFSPPAAVLLWRRVAGMCLVPPESRRALEHVLGTLPVDV